MEKERDIVNKNEKDWFDSPNIITSLIIGFLIVIIILSQSFAIQNHLGFADVFRSILNHNSIYLITLAYFILIKTKVGKKYFDYLNIIMSVILLLALIASLFTIFQSFSLASILSLCSNLLITLYFIYAFISKTVIGKDLGLTSTPIVDIKNSQYFYVLCIIYSVILLVNLISVSEFNDVIIALLEAIYSILFARYVYLYKEFIDYKDQIESTKEKVPNDKKEETKKTKESKKDKEDKEV